MATKDFTVWLNERYEESKKDFEKHFVLTNALKELPQWLNAIKLCYEERSCMSRMTNIDYNRLFVGARLYMDSTQFGTIGCKFDEIEITHLYGGVLFYKFLEGKHKGEENYIHKQSLAMYTHIYPKIVMKPSCIEMTCDCERTQFKNW